MSKDDSIATSDALKRDTQLRKLHFILNEIINDMGIKKGNFMDWMATILLGTAVFELRMIIHYIGQWIFLKVAAAPVISINFKWYEIEMEYAYWKMEQ